MGSYYYLISQLPYLIYGQKAPMTPAAFRELARPMLRGRDAALFDLVSLDPWSSVPGKENLSCTDKIPPCGSVFIDSWRKWEQALRLNLAKQRFIKLKRDGVPTEPPVEPFEAAAVAVKVISAVESPLEVEFHIDKARWSAIEELEGLNYFDRNTIYAYMLKLLILERRDLFQTETGFSEYKSLYASIIESAAGLSGVQSGVVPAGEAK